MPDRKFRFGLTLPNRGVINGATTVEGMFALAQQADASAGWDSVWVGDSLFAKPRLDALVLLGALAARTQRVKLGPACFASTPLRNALLLAYQWCSLDFLSGGRTIFVACQGAPGQGSGTFEQEFAAFQIEPTTRMRRMEEAIEILRLTSSQEHVSYQGQYNRFDDLSVLPRPLQHPIPIWVIATNFCHLDGTYYAPLVLQALIEEARGAGATFRYECEAGPQDLDAEIVVIAAGSWSRQVGAALGVDLAVEAVERSVFQVNPGVALPNNVPFLIDAANGWAMREREGRLLLVPPGDPNNWEETRAWLERSIPTAPLDRPEAHWTGFYEVTFDHHPLVGETSRPGVWASCGFSGHGVMHSPAIADNLAAKILGQTPPLDISPLSPLRTEPLIDATQV